MDTCLAVLDMMDRGIVTVIVDARRDDVEVPEQLRAPGLVLHVAWSRYFRVPVANLEVDHCGFRGTFSVRKSPVWLDVPWTAVWRAAGGGRNVLWGERCPPGIIEASNPKAAQAMLGAPVSTARQPASPGLSGRRTKLAAIPPEGEQTVLTSPTGKLRLVSTDPVVPTLDGPEGDLSP